MISFWNGHIYILQYTRNNLWIGDALPYERRRCTFPQSLSHCSIILYKLYIYGYHTLDRNLIPIKTSIPHEKLTRLISIVKLLEIKGVSNCLIQNAKHQSKEIKAKVKQTHMRTHTTQQNDEGVVVNRNVGKKIEIRLYRQNKNLLYNHYHKTDKHAWAE